MAQVGTDHVARIGLGWLYGTDLVQCENTFYVLDPTDNLFSDPEGFCDQVKSAAVAQLVPSLFAAVQINAVFFEDVRSVPFGGLEKSYTPVPGTHVGAAGALPGNVVLAIKKGTGALGRSGRGRWYWPLADVSILQTDDTVKSSYVTAITAALGAFQAAVEGGTYPCTVGIVSYQTGKVLRPSGFFQAITSWTTADLTTDSQRRRLGGRGR